MDLKRLLEEEEMANDETTEHHSEYSFYVSDAAEVQEVCKYSDAI